LDERRGSGGDDEALIDELGRLSEDGQKAARVNSRSQRGLISVANNITSVILPIFSRLNTTAVFYKQRYIMAVLLS